MYRERWSCPNCGRQFARRNQSHVCGRFSVENHLDKVSPEVAKLYEQFVGFIKSCGEVSIAPTKTSIAFTARTLFAVVHFRKKWLRVGFWLSHPIENPRITRLEKITAQNYVHNITVASMEDLDDELKNWLSEAYFVAS